MFFRGFFKFFLKFVSFKKVVRYLDLFYFNLLINMHKNIKNVELLDKFVIFFCSNIFSKNYTVFNKNTLSVIYFRKKNLPMLEEWFKKSVHNFYYNVSRRSEILINFFFFIEENHSFDNFKKMFKNENNILNTYIFLRSFSGMNHFFNKQFYTSNNEENLVKIYFIFYKLFLKNKTNFPKSQELRFYNLKNYKSWFLFTYSISGLSLQHFFSKNFKKWYFERLDETCNLESLKDWNKKSSECYNFSNYNDEFKWKSIASVYSEMCQNFFKKSTIKLIGTVFNIKINFNHLWCIFIDNDFLKKINNYVPTRHSDSSVNKFINLSRVDDFVVYHLRKIKIFNKGRYSRNRQTYRTGFYWCLWLNIFVVYGLQFVFYRYTFTYGYLWIFLFIFIGTFVFSRALKYNLIDFNYIWAEKKEFFKFFKFIFINFYVVLKKSIEFLFNYFLSLLGSSEHKKVIWSESDFDIDLYNFFDKQWFYDIRNWFNDNVNDYFNDDVVNTVLTEIELSESKYEKNILESEKSIEQIWLSVIHEYAAYIYQKLLLEFQEFQKRFLKNI